MVSLKNFFFAVFAILVMVCALPTSGNPIETETSPDSQDAPTLREGRFYGGMGMSGSQASASASASAGATGLGYGNPMGGYGGWGWGK